jgi:hypothetical protein
VLGELAQRHLEDIVTPFGRRLALRHCHGTRG